MEIPEGVSQAMREAEIAWNKLNARKNMQTVWSDPQLEVLGLLAEVVAKTHNALHRLIDANS